MMAWPLYIAAALLAIAVLVFVHELGHFLVAKAFGVGIPVFSIGFGPPLYSVEYKGTEYRLSAIPLGGYVRMAGADPFGDLIDEEFVDPEEDFGRKPVWQRLLILLAGPAFNLMLPVVLITIALMSGEPNRDTTLGQVVQGSAAQQAGLMSGDKVVAVDGQPVVLWRELDMALAQHTEDAVAVEVQRGEERVAVTLPPGSVKLLAAGTTDCDQLGLIWYERSNHIGVVDPDSPAGRAGLRTDDVIESVDGVPTPSWDAVARAFAGSGPAKLVVKRRDAESKVQELQLVMERGRHEAHPGDPFADAGGAVPLVVLAGEVVEDGPAKEAGIQAGDRIFAVDGTAVVDFQQLMALLRAASAVEGATEFSEPRAVDVVIVRNGQRHEMSIRPMMYGDVKLVSQVWRPILGLKQRDWGLQEGGVAFVFYPFTQALPGAVNQTVLGARQTLHALVNLITFNLPANKGVGGVVAMSEMAAKAASLGLFPYLRFVGVLSINLGIFNLLPVPVLDGGQITIFSLEAVRGRPVSAVLRERLQMAGVLFMVAVMLFALVNDTNGLITRLMES